MPLSTQEQLDLVRESIAAVLNGGQRYRLPNGTEVERPSLDKLRESESELESRLKAESGGTGYTRVSFGRPA